MDARDFIKSDWIRGDELPSDGKPIKATISGVESYTDQASGERKICFRIKQLDNRKLDINKTNLRMLIPMFVEKGVGTEMQNWVGHSIGIYQFVGPVRGEIKKMVRVDPTKYAPPAGGAAAPAPAPVQQTLDDSDIPF